MPIDSDALREASRALQEQLEAEADEQRAYFYSFADGRVSLELEWVNLTELAQVAVVAYLDALRCKLDRV